jgi:hypothetical protein
MDVVHGGQPSPSLLLKFAPLVRPVARSSFVPGLPVPQVATSPHPSADRCKGKDKIFHQQDFLEPGAGRSSSPDYPPGFGPHNLAHFTLGPTITGPIIHGPTNHHSHSGHLQLAQQLTGVMGHSSSGLTLFGPLALHFYQGFTSSDSSRDTEHLPLPHNPSPLAGISHVSISPSSPLHVST